MDADPPLPDPMAARAAHEHELLGLCQLEGADVLRTRLVDQGFSLKAIEALGKLHSLKQAYIKLLTQQMGEAAYHGNTIGVTRLLKDGWDPNSTLTFYDGWAPLTCASAGGHTEIMKVLLAGGMPANIEWVTEMGYSALHTAAELRRTLAVQLLIGHRAEVDRKALNGSTPLFWAAYGGHVDAVQILLDAGADVHIASREGTALDAAQRRGHTDVAEQVLVTMSKSASSWDYANIDMTAAHAASLG
jgi:ankyrin repeat protein